MKMGDISDYLTQAASVLGYGAPKAFQKDAVDSIFKRNDVFLMAPTGSGKSFIYESTPLVANLQGTRTDALVIIISPLTALIETQIATLHSKGQCAIHLRADEGVEIPPDCSYIFSSPETILTSRRDLLFSERVKQSMVALFIDEAHCIIKWGKDDAKSKKSAFRKHYGRIGEIRSLLPESVPAVVMTATAMPNARKEIVKIVGMRRMKEIIISPDRANIRYSSVHLPRYDLYTVFKSSIDDIEANGKASERVIVYCRKKEQCSDMFELFTHSLGNRGYSDGVQGDDRTRLFAMFHSKTSESVKESVVKSFLDPSGHIRILFCTVAFGMGVDVKGVEHVIHVGPSNTIEDYIQESGRAGRGSTRQAHALLVTYPHSTSGNVNNEMKQYCKETKCKRNVLLAAFGFHDTTPRTGEKHACCDGCASECTCSQCSKATCNSFTCMSTMERSIVDILAGSTESAKNHLIVNGDRRLKIHKKLLEHRNQMAEGINLFVGVDLSTGFTRTLIDSVTAQVESVSGPEYLMSNFNFLDRKHAEDTWNIICDVLESDSDIEADHLNSTDSDSDREHVLMRYRQRPVVHLDSSDSE